MNHYLFKNNDHTSFTRKKTCNQQKLDPATEECILEATDRRFAKHQMSHVCGLE